MDGEADDIDSDLEPDTCANPFILTSCSVSNSRKRKAH